MRRIGIVIVTVLASVIVVPVVFVLLAVVNWNIVVPLIIATCAIGSDWLEIFIWQMFSPFRNSMKSVRLLYRYTDDAMQGKDTLHIQIEY